MKSRSGLLAGWAAVCLLAVWLPPAAAYIDILPPTLGNLCRQATRICVLRVDKASAGNEVILFKSGEQLKGKLPLQDGPDTKLVIRPSVPKARALLDWVAKGKTAIL